MVFNSNIPAPIKYRTSYKNKSYILVADEAMMYYSQFYKGNICEVIVPKHCFGVKSDGLLRLRLKPSSFGFKTECGFYEKDILHFFTTDKTSHVGEVIFTTMDNWFVKDVNGELFTKEDIHCYRVLGSTLSGKPLSYFINKAKKLPA